MGSKLRVLVIIPAYNEEESIVATVEELRSVVPEYDYVVVNDGPADQTAQICKEHEFQSVTSTCQPRAHGSVPDWDEIRLQSGLLFRTLLLALVDHN